MSDTVPKLETAYRELRGPLFGALAKLATQGFVASPADALDLIHDFFLDAWPGIARRFDPQKGGLPGYLFGAFVRFARPRIIRLQRQRAMLLPPEALTRLSDAVRWASHPEEGLDLARFEGVLAKLPAEHQDLLRRWLDAPRQSERESARSLGVSRYELRQRLIGVLGRIATALGAIKTTRDLDSQVAALVWRDGFTAPDAARRLGVPLQQVRNAYARNQELMRLTLGRMQPESLNDQGSTNMKSTDIPVEQLLREFPGSPEDQRILAELELRAPDLVKVLNDMSGDLPDEWEALSSAQLAGFYRAIARGLGHAPGEAEELPVEDVYVEGAIEDRVAVGRAFAEVLLPALRRGVEPLLTECRRGVRAVHLTERQRLIEQPDVSAGGDQALALTEYGLTPSHLVLASDAVAMQVARALAANFFPPKKRLLFDRDGYVVQRLRSEEGSDYLSRDDLVDELGVVASVRPRVASALLDWSVDASHQVRGFFNGYAANLDGNQVSLTAAARRPSDSSLLSRWSPNPASIRWNIPQVSPARYEGMS